MFWLSYPCCHVLAAMFCWLCFGCHVLAVLSLLSCLGCHGLLVLFWQSCSGCPVFVVMFWLPCSVGPVLTVMFWWSCSSCLFSCPVIAPILALRLCFISHHHPVLAVSFCLARFVSSVFVILIYLSCYGSLGFPHRIYRNSPRWHFWLFRNKSVFRRWTRTFSVDILEKRLIKKRQQIFCGYC